MLNRMWLICITKRIKIWHLNLYGQLTHIFCLMNTKLNESSGQSYYQWNIVTSGQTFENILIGYSTFFSQSASLKRVNAT